MEYSFRKDIPVAADADVVVVGAGPAGLSAAVTAARNGADVLLAEQAGQPGGMAFAGEVQPFMPNHINHKTLDGPVYKEWLRAMRKYLPDTVSPLTDELSEWQDLKIEKNAAMLAAEDLCLEAGVRLLYHHTLFDVVREDGRIRALVFHAKDGLCAVTGRIFIDSTGDGDLAALAGCPFEFGDGKGDCQPMTLCFKMEEVDDSRRLTGPELSEIWKEAKRSGEIKDAPNDSIGQYEYMFRNTVHFNQIRIGGLDPLTGGGLSGAEIEGRRQLRQLLAFLKRHAPGYEKARLHSVADRIGARESRRILGRAFLTIDDYDALRKFPDAIARVHYPVDIHNSKKAGYVYRPLPENDWYEIPYGCLVARGIDNLLIASRCLSSDHVVNSSLRVMPVMTSVGQGAGMAAALCMKKGLLPPGLDGCEVRKALIAFGAKLGDFEVDRDMVRTDWEQP